ncbi:MAG TPA: hypothetical protein VES73_12390 [Lamprocystis sp. (in: g-proteobacteria)]|nr:hypothetical protein [Lamprocystis sp. (in: g-proteobacteria)]
MNPKGSYAEDWSMHPGAALRKKRGLTAKEQQALAMHPAILDQAVFESPGLVSKAFYADSKSLIFCGEVREVLGGLHAAGVSSFNRYNALSPSRFSNSRRFF